MMGCEAILLTVCLGTITPTLEAENSEPSVVANITAAEPTQLLAQHSYYTYPRYRPYYWYSQPSRLYRPGMYSYPVTPGYSQGMPPVYQGLHTTPYGYYRKFPYYHPSYSRFR